MSTDNTYLVKFNKIITDFDKSTKKEITKAVNQSINDLNLENSDFKQIMDKLGSPQEFVDEYIKETNIVSWSSSVKIGGSSKLELSFMIIKIMQIMAIAMTPIIIQDEMFPEESVLISSMEYYLWMVIIFSLTFGISKQVAPSVTYFGSFYYKSFIALTLFIFSNIVTDDYIIGLDQYAMDNMNYIEISKFGIFLFLMAPIAFMSGLKLTMIKENLSLYENEIIKISRENIIKKSIMDITKLLILFAYILTYTSRSYSILRNLLIFSTSIVIVEYLIIFRSQPGYYKTKLLDIVKINLTLIGIYLAASWLYNTIWGNY